ncbi:TonB-dependent receptor family protein [Pedobacter sp. N36a]|uniref:outer membrane beta-barrel family protein n=1 Tax=Pedobacter sp. N36a TaxID=2767996 RepID=UPI001656D91D|nr:outer membrane beta-barrel family protein [Pedobacter sp. N36a]MBC8986990.1 TonB-dependent receptor family protein [Pedobacter sp. N36a]
MHSKLLTTLLILFSLTCAAQVKITGKLLDMESKPVSYATVVLLTGDSSCYQNELTTKEGDFILIAKSGQYLLKLSIFGKLLHRKAIQLSHDLDLGVLQVNLNNELKTVHIVGQRPLVQMENDKLIFNVESSPLKSGYSGLDVLARAPRLQVNGDGAVLLRNKIPVIYVNGRQLYLTGRDLASYLSSLNAERIQNIEIQAQASADADAAAQGGVVNIILKKPVKGLSSNFTGSYTYRKGNIWSDYLGLNTNYGSDKWNFYTKISYGKDKDFGTYHTTKLFSSQSKNEADGLFNGDKRNVNLLAGMVFYPDSKNEFGAELYYNNGKGLYTTPESLTVYAPSLSSISSNQRSENFKNKVWYGALNYTFKLDRLGSTLKFILNAGHHENPSDNSTNTDDVFGNFNSSLTVFNADPRSDYYVGQGDLTKKYKNGFQLKSGLKMSSVNREHQLNTRIYQAPDYLMISYNQENFTNKENIAAVYGTLTGKISKKGSFNLGLRAEYTDFSGKDKINTTQVSRHYLNLFPRLYYGYTIAPKRTFSISLARNIQRPSFRDLNPFITKENDYSYLQGNPDLKPQFTNSLDISYQLPKQSLSFYINHTEDLIAGVYTNIGNITYYKPQNFGSQSRYGLDYSYFSNLTKWLYTNTALGAYYYKFKNGDLQPSQYAFNSNVYTRFSLSKTWSSDLLNVFNSRFQNYVVSAAPQYRLDFSLQKSIIAGKAQLKFACNDVFNTQRDKNFSIYEDFSLDFYQKRRTRSFLFMFVYSFSTQQKVKNKAIEANQEIRGRL